MSPDSGDEAVSHKPWYAPLTPRHAELAELVAAGLTTEQIAAHFVVHRKVVENHLQQILGRLDLESRSQIGEWVTTHRPRTDSSD